MTSPLPRMTTPALLVAGDVILDSKGREVTVEAERHEHIYPDGIRRDSVSLRRGDTVHEVPLSRLPEQVHLVTTAAEAHERAVALAQVRLGGEVVAHRDGDGPYRVPERFVDLASLLGHLYLFHQTPGRDPKVPATFPQGPMGEVAKHHEDDHTRVLVVPHVHEPAFYRRAGVDTPAAGA